MNANLLLFKTVVAIDSWGRVAVPLIERNPLAAFIFCGCPAASMVQLINQTIHRSGHPQQTSQVGVYREV